MSSNPPTKVLFLDLDGVVNNAALFKAQRDHADTMDWDACTEQQMDDYVMCADPDKVSLIADLCTRTSTRLVISSVWRSNMARVQRLFAPELFHPTSPRTTSLHPMEPDTRRGHQIDFWLFRHPEVRTWAIVDDDGDMLDTQRHRFVQTTFETGVTPEHIQQLEQLLQDPAP